MCCIVHGGVSNNNVPKSGTIPLHSEDQDFALPVVGMSAKETGDSIWFIFSLQTLNHGCACYMK
jgi:hypothetical protein